jgi:hypothetical protein
MQRHVLAGVKIIDQMHFLERETPIVRHHHEHWTGGGYPDGISGEAVPLGARILAVADAFDAITADRVYRKARSVSEALQVLIEESGRQFAPGVVDAMVKWILATGRELGKESDLAVADLLSPERPHRGGPPPGRCVVPAGASLAPSTVVPASEWPTDSLIAPGTRIGKGSHLLDSWSVNGYAC